MKLKKTLFPKPSRDPLRRALGGVQRLREPLARVAAETAPLAEALLPAAIYVLVIVLLTFAATH